MQAGHLRVLPGRFTRGAVYRALPLVSRREALQPGLLALGRNVMCLSLVLDQERDLQVELGQVALEDVATLNLGDHLQVE